MVRDALGVGVAVGLSGFAFGVTAAGAGLDVLQTAALSFFVFTGASQFALVGALAAGGNPLTAAAGAFFLGVRNAFYGLRLSGLLQLPRSLRPLAAHGVIDESAAVALAQPDRRSARLGFAVTAVSVFVLWNLTTVIGALGASALGDTDAWGLDAAGPAVFLALLAPKLTTTTERAVAGLGVLLVLACVPVLPTGVPVLVAALAAPAVLVAERSAGRRATRTGPAGAAGTEAPGRAEGTGGTGRAGAAGGSGRTAGAEVATGAEAVTGAEETTPAAGPGTAPATGAAGAGEPAPGPGGKRPGHRNEDGYEDEDEEGAR